MISYRLFYYSTIVFLFTQLVFANTLSLTDIGDDTWDVNYISNDIISGFQFNVDGATVNSASGGDAAENGFMISSSATIVIGFSLTGSTIPSGEGILLVLDISGIPTGLSGIIVSDSSGAGIDFTYYDGGGCTDESACNYDSNATQDDGSCEYPENNYDCNGNCIEELDECGVCNGDGSSCAVYMVDVLYNSDTDIAGFQFNVENVVLIGASGGEAEAIGFMVSTGGNVALGFSLTGDVISAGSGVLTTLEVEGVGACISGLILSDSGGNALNATIDDCININYSVIKILKTRNKRNIFLEFIPLTISKYP